MDVVLYTYSNLDSIGEEESALMYAWHDVPPERAREWFDTSLWVDAEGNACVICLGDRLVLEYRESKCSQILPDGDQYGTSKTCFASTDGEVFIVDINTGRFEKLSR